jgi:hypothetical protein
MNRYVELEVQRHALLTSVVDGVVSFIPRPLYLRYRLDRKLGGAHSQSENCAGKRISTSAEI